jgi:hypothetical protein
MANLYLTIASGIIVAVGLLYSGTKITVQVFENDRRYSILGSFGIVFKWGFCFEGCVAPNVLRLDCVVSRVVGFAFG